MNQAKKILLITGSPRKGGNSSLMADAFTRGVESTDHTLVRFDAGRKDIKACIACGKCFSKGKACVFNDDFNELAPDLERADMLVFVSPLYWFSFPVQIKAAIDKLYAMMVGKRDMKVKESMLLVCAETDDMSDFDGIVRSYELINRYMNWTDKGTLLVPNVNKVGDIIHTDALAKAEQMGRDIV